MRERGGYESRNGRNGQEKPGSLEILEDLESLEDLEDLGSLGGLWRGERRRMKNPLCSVGGTGDKHMCSVRRLEAVAEVFDLGIVLQDVHDAVVLVVLM